jgi:hypothetical protein
MNARWVTRIFTPLLLLLISFSSFSQQNDVARTKAVLVQVRSEHSRMQAMQRKKDFKSLQQVKAESKAVAMAMIYDFKDNFSYCPVYFYMDTNLQYIKERRFEGILFNAEGEIVDSPIVSNADTNYLVVFYGKPATQGRGTAKVKDSANYRVGTSEPFGVGLVILNYKLEQVNYIYKLISDELLFKRKRAKRRKSDVPSYSYFSKKYDMEYFHLAEKLSKRLTEHDGNPIFNDRH